MIPLPKALRPGRTPPARAATGRPGGSGRASRPFPITARRSPGFADGTSESPPGAAPAPGRGRYKRAFDLGAITVLGLALLPLWALLAASVAVAIRLESPGPVLYAQTRLGRGGRTFRMLKFRTMVHGAEKHTGPAWARSRDARATRVGRVLRRLHLDELPQVANVVRGEMSLVGPRPERPDIAARIEREVPAFPGRLRVRPGIMGLAQFRGGYHTHPRRKLRYDNLYIDRMSPWLDIRLCVACVCKVALGNLRRRRTRRESARFAAAGSPPGAHGADHGRARGWSGS